MTAAAVVFCVTSLTPALASQTGGFAHPSLLQKNCCLAVQTQVLLAPASGVPNARTVSESQGTSRRDAGHALSSSWRGSDGDIRQAPSFTAGLPPLLSGGRWIRGQTSAATGTADRFVTELTAGDAQVLAYVGSGETETWLVQASAVNQSPEGRDCPAASCAESPANRGSFSVSGAYDAAARAIGSSDTGSTVAQASQSGSDQKDSSQPPAGGTEQGTIDPAAPDSDSTASGEEFSGSPEPAGPDLTVSEEQSAISQGWK